MRANLISRNGKWFLEVHHDDRNECYTKFMTRHKQSTVQSLCDPAVLFSTKTTNTNSKNEKNGAYIYIYIYINRWYWTFGPIWLAWFAPFIKGQGRESEGFSFSFYKGPWPKSHGPKIEKLPLLSPESLKVETPPTPPFFFLFSFLIFLIGHF